MKFDVPLMMPAIHSIRLAVRPSRSALMIGMPPATAPSKATITPLACAAAKISLPCRASSALLAVTTCLPLAIACRMNVRAGSMPPISSTTMSMSGCARTTAASSVRLTPAAPRVSSRARSSARSAIHVMRIGRPARRAISSSLRRSTVHVPIPTVPMPSRPTCSGFICGFAIAHRPRVARRALVGPPSGGQARPAEAGPTERSERGGRSCQQPVVAEHLLDAAYRLPRARSRSRSSRSGRSSSPYSPKPMPGDTDTFACASSLFANSSEPAAR